MIDPQPNKNLGQHWLHDEAALDAICDAAELTQDDIVLEIGPGLGTLTKKLAQRAKKVIAVEFDPQLARQLAGRVRAENLEVIHSDILKFDLTRLPSGYKVVANVPYYITSKIVQLLMTSHNPPTRSVLLVQKEVAERMAARPGDMSILAVSAQLFAEVSLGEEVPAYLFTPPPKVDSQVVILQTHQKVLYPDITEEDFFTAVKAGFSAKRKKLRSSVAGGLKIEKPEAEELLNKAEISPDARAETLSLDDWARLARLIR